MAQKQHKIIGIDVGGTKILLQIFDAKMNLLEQVKVKTVTSKGEKGFTKQILELIESKIDKNVKGIGIAVPGIVNVHNGNLVKAPHLPTKINYPLKKLVEKKFKVKVIVDNDINAFLIAEKESPKLKKHNNIIALMLGTGLGGAITANGEMVYGRLGYSGEVGHMIIDNEDKLRTLEQNTSGSFVPQIAKKLGIKKKITAYDLEKKTPEAKRIKAHIMKSLSTGLSNLNLIFDPDAFVLGGSIYKLFLSDQKKKLQNFIKTHSLDKTSPKIIDARSSTSVARGMALKIAEIL